MYPSQDDCIRDYLIPKKLARPFKNIDEIKIYYSRFFAAVFTEVLNEIQTLQEQQLDYSSLTKAWHTHLEKVRSVLYQRIVETADRLGEV